MVRSAASRALRRAGRDVSLTNREKTGEDDYGPDFGDTTDSPHTVKARVERRDATDVRRDAGGTEVQIEADIYIDASTTAASNVTDGGHGGASRVEVDGETYVVVAKDVQDNGLLKLLCARKD